MFSFLSFVSMLFLFSPMATANPEAPIQHKRVISVSGSAEVKVVPNQVIVFLAVENRGSTLSDAQDSNDEVIKKFIQFLTKKLKLPATHIQTDQFQVVPYYNHCYDQESGSECDETTISYFSVSKNIQIHLNNIEHYDTLIEQAFAAGITRIDNVQFTTTDLKTHRDNAREMAAIAAREKAQAVASTLDMTVGKPIDIRLGQSNWAYHQPGYGGVQNSRSMAEAYTLDSPEATTLALGQISIYADVYVVFEME